MQELFSIFLEGLNWVKEQAKDKAGAFVLGMFFSGLIGFAFFISESWIRKSAEKEITRLEEELKQCEGGRAQDKRDFFENMKEVYNFTQQLKVGFDVIETQSRKLAEEKEQELNNLSHE